MYHVASRQTKTQGGLETRETFQDGAPSGFECLCPICKTKNKSVYGNNDRLGFSPEFGAKRCSHCCGIYEGGRMPYFLFK